MIVAPATCNTLARLAAGISDTLHLGLIVEAAGKRQPICDCAVLQSGADQVAFPWDSAWQTLLDHPWRDG